MSTSFESAPDEGVDAVGHDDAPDLLGSRGADVAAAHLEWGIVVDAFVERLASDVARDRVRDSLGGAGALPRTTDPAVAQAWLDELDALAAVAGADGGATLGAALSQVVGLHEQLERARRGAVLELHELGAVADLVEAAREVGALISGPGAPSRVTDRSDAHEHEAWARGVLVDRLGAIDPPPALARRLAESIERSDAQITLADGASPQLGALRSRQVAARRALRTAAERILRRPQLQDALADRYWTEREGRIVLPVRSDGFARGSEPNKISGIIVGSSSSGQTLWVEPHALAEASNALREAELAVRAEERRIIVGLSKAVGDEADALAHGLEALARLDRIRARLLLSHRIEGVRPRVGAPQSIDTLVLPGARHPLMVLANAEVVPNDLRAHVGQALVVSGPNAGGKTVALKTIGLCVMMAEAGLRLPTSAPADVALYRAIVTDVGDDQSIARNLSTFSAHVEHLRAALDHARHDGATTLVLLDEVAAGTDPEQGAALAEAVLVRLVELGATVVVTTHYERLKLLATQRPEAFTNAAVGFDLAALRPTFELRIGAPGSSSAIAVARQLGMPALVLERAEALLSDERLAVDALLREVEAEREAMRAQRRALQAEREALHGREAKLAAKERGHEETAQRRRAKAHQAAASELRAFEDEIRRRRKALRRAEPDRGGAGRPSDADARAFARQARQRLDDARPAAPTPEGAPPSEVTEGQRVRVHTFGARGEVLTVKGDRITVQLPGAKVTVGLDELRPAEPEPKKAEPAPTRIATPDTSSAARHFGTDARPVQPRMDNVVDLRGARADEALTMLEVFLDRAIADDQELVIVQHGHGSGALRKAVREHLPHLGHVVRHRPGLPPEGGDAVTVVWVRA